VERIAPPSNGRSSAPPERIFEKFPVRNALYVLEAGINKPYDRIAKEFAEEAPLLFLRLLGMAGQLEPLRAETAPPVKIPDYVATLRPPGQEAFTFHVEFLVHYREEVPSGMARYGGSLAWQYLRPVQSVLFLMKAAGVPEEIPSFGEYTIGKTRLVHPFRTVRLWELDRLRSWRMGIQGCCLGRWR
jgi:hypothetical protein